MGLRVVRCWPVIILVINKSDADFVITRMITDRIGLHSVLLPVINFPDNIINFAFGFVPVRRDQTRCFEEEKALTTRERQIVPSLVPPWYRMTLGRG